MRRGRREATGGPPDRLRRDLIEWLGKSAVLSLSGAALISCLGSGRNGPPPDGDLPADGDRDGDPVPDGDTAEAVEREGEAEQDGVPDGDLDREGSTDHDPETGDDFPFSPGDRDDPVYRNWGERTVDYQNLEQILASWRLSVDGLVDRPAVFSFPDLIGLPRTDQTTDFHCVEGWSILDVPWNGIHLSSLLEQTGIAAAATHATFHTLGGTYNESLPLSIALEPKTILGYGIAGNTLPLPHGFPLRLVVPRLLGYKNAKYIGRIELTDHPIEGFWVAAGYPYDGNVPAHRLREGRY